MYFCNEKDGYKVKLIYTHKFSFIPFSLVLATGFTSKSLIFCMYIQSEKHSVICNQQITIRNPINLLMLKLLLEIQISKSPPLYISYYYVASWTKKKSWLRQYTRNFPLLVLALCNSTSILHLTRCCSIHIKFYVYFSNILKILFHNFNHI